jgi:tRNA uridine 5-carboxymethylaminomethyl modification enzyme
MMEMGIVSLLDTFDVLVVGGGHAGIEACLINARLGNKVALVTIDKSKIGQMPCNPSIGGSAKGILVREIDALGGEMGRAADATALQFKLLNTSGGPAIQALRVQSDKTSYSQYMQKLLNESKNLTIVESVVNDLIIENKKVKGVTLGNGEKLNARLVIITTGTYLQPLTYKGQEEKPEGPEGEKKVINKISQKLKSLGFKLKRFKTGTSPRILTDSIDFSGLVIEPGTNLQLRFSKSTNISALLPFEKQLPCYLTYTSEKTHQIIRDNSHLSPIFYKKDLGVGPRYCPSIEHKVCIFSDKERHQIFLEPESLQLDTTYIQGLSTSLPSEVQDKVLRTIPGLEKAVVKKWGYAIEYDVIDSTQLKINLESKLIEGLFFAGQINGTTGYEEAASQGLIAGINANQKLSDKEAFVLGRDQAYLGVLVEDLVSKEITDPYRLLTSRAEHRLLLRHDNVYTRLSPVAEKFGLISKKDLINFRLREEKKKEVKELLKKKKLIINEELPKIFPSLEENEWKNKKTVSLLQLLKKQPISLIDFLPWIEEIDKLQWEEKREIEVDVKYEGYIRRQLEEVEELKKYGKEKIPENLNYEKIGNLASEAREKLNKIRPNTLSQAMRISGVNPTDIQIIHRYLKSKDVIK